MVSNSPTCTDAPRLLPIRHPFFSPPSPKKIMESPLVAEEDGLDALDEVLLSMRRVESEMARDDDMSAIKNIGDYRLTRVLGEGSFGKASTQGFWGFRLWEYH